MQKIIILLSILCFSCSQNTKIEDSSQDSTNQISQEIVEIKKDTLPLLDTTIFIKSVKQKVDSPKPVYRQMVIEDLYAYFKKKGRYIEHNVPLDLSENENPICINTDTTMVYLADLNNDNQLDAIVEYYDFVCYGSSHCNQPHKLIVMNNENKFVIQSEYLDFIPISYNIDSIKISNQETTIYGYDYFCYDHKVTGYLKVHLKHSN
ncbi:hypothetical protein Fleli_3143 [Bernardetia litoralis DSM 6794]|uniref:Uncharacterized protein n=1 Tax=Bernardetia litoralis (strain ATCC 23117 / DSM 6794 / NBRC 15988 / NCIMB 1366 / Fx l1 / Sio-4) TaxID=880071 RepID=I4ANE4_BERLS|nr:hypothetical protein [Bernardetia litoralis]AFM05479.1 hypothetical protein Fleli_3143 [Bernardetia litoralis DSM 6794]